jgi:hypothetical protein
MMIMTVDKAARLRRLIDFNSRRCNGENNIAVTVPHRTAPYNGNKIQAKASDTAMVSSKKALSSMVAHTDIPSGKLEKSGPDVRSFLLLLGKTANQITMPWRRARHQFIAKGKATTMQEESSLI